MNAGQLYVLAQNHVARPDAATDPVDVAAAMVAEIPDHDLRSSLRAALPLLVRRVLGNQSSRRKAAKAVNGSASPLDQVVCAGHGRWKPLRECTRSELEGMAAFRRTVAEQHTTVAQRYERLARQMAELGLQTVGEVSVDALTDALPV